MESSTFFKAYLSSDWWWLEITFMYGLECQESLSAAPDTLHSRNTDAKSAPTGPTSSRAENIAFPYSGKLPGFQNTTMNAPSESSRPRRGIQRSPAGDLVEEQDQFLIKNTKNVNQVWKHQQTITNYFLLCVITCVTVAIPKPQNRADPLFMGG